MRQGEVGHNTAWSGSPLGGVVAPEPILLPDPRTRFARSAARMRSLAVGHPASQWLDFMAMLMRAQHAAAQLPIALCAPSRNRVEQAVAEGQAPLAAAGHRCGPAWHQLRAALIDALAPDALPPPAQAILVELRGTDDARLVALADDFLAGAAAPGQAGPLVFVVAALQIYFTGLAAGLDVASLRLLARRGLCPCCGSAAVVGLITASGATPGTRYLYCGLCSTAWNHIRASCVTCGESRALGLHGIEGDGGIVKAETCDICHSYAKMLYQAKDMAVDPYADDLATLGLDFMVAEAGWARNAANPLLLLEPESDRQ